MATTKLSDALAALQAAASVSGLTVRLVVAGKDATEKAQTITLAQLLTALGVPTLQTGAAGMAGKYIYSNCNDKTKGALSGVFKVYQNNKELYLRHKYWGSSDNYDDGQYSTAKIPSCTTSADGVMEWEYLVRLRNATMTETGTTTGVNITYPNFADGGTKTLTLTAATTAKAGVMTVDQVNALNSASMAAKAAQSGVNAISSYTDTLQNYIIGELGKYDSSEAFDTALSNMTQTSHQNGRYFATVGDVPLFVTFEVLNIANNVLSQWVEGSVAIGNDGKIYANTSKGTRILSRIYADNAWGEWKASALTGDLPTVQTDAAGTNANYIYSKSGDTAHEALSGAFRIYQNQGKLILQHKLWGSSATNYDEAHKHSANFPQVNTSADGAMNHDVYGRITNNTLSEVGSTTEAVKINYTNFANGGASTLTISKATTAKAGAMTAEHVKELNSLSTHIQDLGDYANENEALTRIGQLDVCANKKLVHAHLTYATDNASARNTLILIQSIEGKQCRQFIFNKARAFSRLIHFTDETLTSQEHTEDWTFMFADRLEWSTDHHGYLMSQNESHTAKTIATPYRTPAPPTTASCPKKTNNYSKRLKRN